MPIGVAIFDLSETLINSNTLWKTAFIDLLEDLNIKQDEKLANIVEEKGVDPAISILMDYYRVPFGPTDLLKKLSSHAIKNFNSEMTLKEGAIDIIKKLKAHGYATVVVAPGNPMIMELTKTHFGQELDMDDWINTREKNLSKDDPELYLNIAKEFGVKVEDCILFDDLEQLIESASKIGLKTVYIGQGKSEHATVSVKSYFELMEKFSGKTL